MNNEHLTWKGLRRSDPDRPRPLADAVLRLIWDERRISRAEIARGIPAFKLFPQVGLADSGGAARRLISQGGAYVNGERVTAFDEVINDSHIKDMEIVLRAGKKRFHKIKISA